MIWMTLFEFISHVYGNLMLFNRIVSSRWQCLIASFVVWKPAEKFGTSAECENISENCKYCWCVGSSRFQELSLLWWHEKLNALSRSKSCRWSIISNPTLIIVLGASIFYYFFYVYAQRSCRSPDRAIFIISIKPKFNAAYLRPLMHNDINLLPIHSSISTTVNSDVCFLALCIAEAFSFHFNLIYDIRLSY